MKPLLVALVALASSTARAEFLDRDPNYRSPQRFALELKFGAYWPSIDSTPGLTGRPLADLFPDQGNVPNLVGAELDWQFWRPFGSFALGVSVGYSWAKAKAFRYVEYKKETFEAKPCTGTCERSEDDTVLNVMPFTLELVYRFDVLANRYRIPIVPYLKGGIAYYLWWIQSGSGGVARNEINPEKQKGTCGFGDADCGIGGTFGLVAHPGLALQLDVLDPGVARTMDAELGINHAYLFAEMHYAWITGFGAKSKMVLSDLTWNVGVAFEF